jgi:putative tricarboxylic transport membrane protein
MERIYGIIVFALGTAILWQGRHLAFGSFRNPGSGLFPSLLAGLMIILSLRLIIFPQKGEGAERPISKQAAVRVVAIFVTLLLYAFFLELLGFLVVSFVTTTLLFAAFGSRRRYGLAVVRAIVLTGFSYAFFEVLLKSNLPKGIFGF